MEIEAKFRATDPARFNRLLKARSLGDYTLIPLDDESLVDRYLDTDDHRLWEQGYSCRLRESGGSVLATVKGRGSADGAVHRREEIEVEIPSPAPPEEWPPGPARDLVLSLIPSRSLHEIVSIRQHRSRRAIWKEGQCVAELALDRVEMGTGGNTTATQEVEIELGESGRTEDLEALETALEGFALVPEPRSKFERALLLSNLPEEPLFSLSSSERADLEQLAEGPDPVLAKRAQMILMASEGARSVTIGNRIGLSDSYVRRWLRHFRSRRLEIFPTAPGGSERAFDVDAGLDSADVGEPELESGEEAILIELPGGGAIVLDLTDRLQTPGESGMSIEQLCSRYAVDMVHARHVVAMSLALFDRYPDIHRLPSGRRGILEAAAILHNVGLAVDPAKHHTVGRDLILAAPLAGFRPEEITMLACVVRFHRKRVRPDEEPALTSLPADLQTETLALAALLRIGDAFDYSQTQTSRIAAAEWNDGVAWIVIDGPYAADEAARAMKKADLWNAAFPFPIEVHSAEQARQALLDEAAAAPPTATAEAKSSEETGAEEAGSAESRPEDQKISTDSEKKGPGIRPEDPIAEAGRKVLALQFDRLLLHESGTLEGEDIEALHDMRVASRRMRAAMRLFGLYFPSKHLRSLEEGLRRTGGALGPVRDFDVLLEHAERFRNDLPEQARESLDPLLQSWRKQHRKARKEMVGFLQSRNYARFKEEWIRFLNDPIGSRDDSEASLRDPSRRPVRTVVPGLLWEDYGRVLAYGPSLAGAPIDTLHALRIDCKRLRYALEFFKEPLGKPGEKLIAAVTVAQDHLGAMHDADVAAGLIRTFLAGWVRRAARKSEPMGSLGGFTRYLEAREAEITEKIASFLEVWSRIEGKEFRSLLGETILGL